MATTAAMVKALRERTGAPMIDCKKALDETNGDIEAAIDVLRKKGRAVAAKRAGKIAVEGVIVIAVSEDQTKAFMMELNCETDFVARDPSFTKFAYRTAECGLAAQAQDVETTLALVPDPNTKESIDDLRQALIGKIAENIQLRRVVCLSVHGMVGYYCHGQRIGAIVAMDQPNPALGKDIAMHIVASNPLAVSIDDVPSQFIEREKSIVLEQAKNSGKSDAIIEKMVSGRVNKILKEVSLQEQPFFKDPDISVGQLLAKENAAISSFVRYELGEALV